MASFLITSKMDPALAARIEASVSGRRNRPGAARISRRLVAVVRLGLVLVVAFGIYSFVSVRRREHQEIERTRAALLDAVRARSASLTASEKGSVGRAESWLVRLSGPYEDDLVTDELCAPGALTTLLQRETIYVRGPLGGFKNSARIAETASASSKDALLFCLVEPPPSRVEKVLLESVRVAYAGGAPIEERTANIRRLHDVVVGLPLLLPPWSDRVRRADDPADLTRLRRELERAPLDRAKQAARSGLLLVAMDEPGDGGGPTELDGERAHAVRIALVELASSRILLRVRRLVDPTWISLQKKSQYAIGLDSCGLAFDVHEQLRATKK